MPSSSSKGNAKKELYVFDGSYLKELNTIRKQLNLVEIKDDDSNNESVDVQADSGSISSPESRDKQELYSFNNDYLKELNSIRKKLNLKEIEENASSAVKTQEKSRRVSFHEKMIVDVSRKNISGSSKGKEQNYFYYNREESKSETKTGDNEYFQLAYTPPKKKICVRDESPVSSVRETKIDEEKKAVSENVIKTGNRSRISSSKSEKCPRSCVEHDQSKLVSGRDKDKVDVTQKTIKDVSPITKEKLVSPRIKEKSETSSRKNKEPDVIALVDEKTAILPQIKEKSEILSPRTKAKTEPTLRTEEKTEITQRTKKEVEAILRTNEKAHIISTADVRTSVSPRTKEKTEMSPRIKSKKEPTPRMKEKVEITQRAVEEAETTPKANEKTNVIPTADENTSLSLRTREKTEVSPRRKAENEAPPKTIEKIENIQRSIEEAEVTQTNNEKVNVIPTADEKVSSRNKEKTKISSRIKAKSEPTPRMKEEREIVQRTNEKGETLPRTKNEKADVILKADEKTSISPRIKEKPAESPRIKAKSEPTSRMKEEREIAQRTNEKGETLPRTKNEKADVILEADEKTSISPRIKEKPAESPRIKAKSEPTPRMKEEREIAQRTNEKGETLPRTKNEKADVILEADEKTSISPRIKEKPAESPRIKANNEPPPRMKEKVEMTQRTIEEVEAIPRTNEKATAEEKTSISPRTNEKTETTSKTKEKTGIEENLACISKSKGNEITTASSTCSFKVKKHRKRTKKTEKKSVKSEPHPSTTIQNIIIPGTYGIKVDDLIKTRSPLSSPSEKSSPVKDLAFRKPKFPANITKEEFYMKAPQLLNIAAGDNFYRFCSLNVPSYFYDQQRSEVKPTITVLSDDEAVKSDKMPLIQEVDSNEERLVTIFDRKESIDEDQVSLITSSLDLPRKSSESYEFPSIVNINKWPSAFKSHPTTDNIYLNISQARTARKKFIRWAKEVPEEEREGKFLIGRQRLSASRPSLVIGEELMEESEGVETTSGLKVMAHRHERQALDMQFYNVDAVGDSLEVEVKEEEDEETVDEEEEAVERCTCFKLCFSKKKQKFFS